MLMNLIPAIVMVCLMFLQSNIVELRCMNVFLTVYADELDPSGCHGVLHAFEE